LTTELRIEPEGLLTNTSPTVQGVEGTRHSEIRL